MTNKVNNSLAVETKEVELEQRRNKLVRHIETTHLAKMNASPCVGMIWELTGGNPHMAVDEIRDMKSTITDILVFMCDPEIAEKFKSVNTSYTRGGFAKHLKRILNCLDDADDKNVFAEIAHYDLDNFGQEERDLVNFEHDFYK